ncbi:hypothetical protein M405DRAFT_447985 [Rhizopogon salebrosus TDB-379]|nr:hypothetical protein M405DRAFT_447985 [Rhizopogon salebrosus TDB-379]
MIVESGTGAAERRYDTITPLYASWKHGWCLQRNHEPCGEHSLAETRADLSQSVGYLVLHHTYIALRRLFLVLSFIKLSFLDAWSSYYGTHTFKDTGGSDSSKVLSDPAAMGVRSAFVGCEDFLMPHWLEVYLQKVMPWSRLSRIMNEQMNISTWRNPCSFVISSWHEQLEM